MNAVGWGDGDIDNGINQFWNISSDRMIEEPEHYASQSSNSRAALPACGLYQIDIVPVRIQACAGAWHVPMVSRADARLLADR